MTAAVRRRSARRALSVTVVAGVMLTSAASVAAPVAEVDLVISEIMYNPASAEDDWEWVEVYNAGSSEVDLTGFVIDDVNSTAHPGSNIAGGTVAAGGTAVLYNADDLSAVDVEAAWGTGIPLVPVSNWGAMALNNGGDSVAIWSDFSSYVGDNTMQANAIARVPYDDSSPWPADDGASSIFLTDLGADPTNGAAWALSLDGLTTPAGGAAYTSTDGGGNSGSDVGSPGGTLTPQPEPTTLTIPEIQGAAHLSPYLGELVQTSGTVTAVDSNLFYLQDPVGDGDPATSDAIVVFTGSGPGVAVGDSATVTGTVSEFTPGGASTGNLSTSQISADSVTVVSSGNPLPAATVIGTGGRLPPTEVIDDDAFASFDQDDDGIDFYESLEAMLVTVSAPTAVAGTTRFGELYTVPAGVPATSLSERGTLNIGPSDFNPERVQIDEDRGVAAVDIPTVDTGASFGDITGVVGYSFGNFEVIPTAPFADSETPSSLTPEISELESSGSDITVATYNVLNLDPNDNDGDRDVADGRFDAIAAHIVSNLSEPDVVALQEIQDNSGSVNDGIVAADVTLQTLADAIVAAGGPQYAFVDNTFIGDGTSGGQPGANIRTAFLYNPDRVTAVGPASTIAGEGQQTDPSNPFFDSRLPLVQTFAFRGNAVTVVNNHLSSKGGSMPLFGTEQNSTERQEDPSVNGGLDERQAQAAAVKAFVDSTLASDPGAHVVVLGDFNEFEFVSPLLTLAESLTNLTLRLAEDERYSYVFEGNSQSLDHILVSSALEESAQFDAVHVNAEFADVSTRASDHDPLLAQFTLDPVCTITGSNAGDVIVGTDGPDVICGGNGADVIDAAGGDDVVLGGNGADVVAGGPGDDELFGGNGPDELDGGPGDDTIDGGRGPDTCSGGSGDNELTRC